ncbi:MAG: hypothetical protein IAE79_00630, partial [Anaerolinea sp.]|nr:hypothetical protein [Anaerolinea sp.]
TGEQEDAATGLVYLRARYYNPSLKVFISRDPFPGHIALPASQHGYSYAHNNSPNYTDPSGSCIFGGIDTAICLGAGFGFVGGYVGQVANNMHNGMSFFDAVYYKNISWTQVGASTVAGGAAGATGFAVGGAAGGFAGGLLPPATTLAGAVGSGAVTGAIGGFVGGAAAGGAWQLTYNALTPCTTWDENVLRAMGRGAVTGGVVGGVFGGIRGGYGYVKAQTASLNNEIVYVNPAELRWTQRTAGGRGRAANYRESMAIHGWDSPPIDVVSTPDGLVTVDHTRATIALEMNMQTVPARIHFPSDPLPSSMANRFGSSTTWGEAIAYRAANQIPPLSPTGTTIPPRLPK